MKDTIDRNMRRLCRVLNENGYRTIGCCGGHKNPKRLDQKPYGSWFVTVKAEPAKMQWLIEFAEKQSVTFGDISDLTRIIFMRATGINPVEFAKILEKALRASFLPS